MVVGERAEPSAAARGEVDRGARPAPIDQAIAAAFSCGDRWFAEQRRLFDWDGTPARDLPECVLRLLYHNLQVWHYEDFGRTGDDALILVGWRGAMLHNKHRNELINAIDATLAPFHCATAPLHSESLGALVDRITILYLKHKNYAGRSPETAARLSAQLEELIAYAADLQARLVAGELRCQQVPRLKLYLEVPGASAH